MCVLWPRPSLTSRPAQCRPAERQAASRMRDVQCWGGSLPARCPSSSSRRSSADSLGQRPIQLGQRTTSGQGKAFPEPSAPESWPRKDDTAGLGEECAAPGGHRATPPRHTPPRVATPMRIHPPQPEPAPPSRAPPAPELLWGQRKDSPLGPAAAQPPPPSLLPLPQEPLWHTPCNLAPSQMPKEPSSPQG